MEINKILSADLLDLLFEGRNKAYGAYELRKTYQRRVTKALVITFTMAGLIVTGTLLARETRLASGGTERYTAVEIQAIEEEEKIPEPLPEPEPEPPQQTRTEMFTEPVVVDDTQVQEPPPSQDDLSDAKIDVFTSDGKNETGIVEPAPPDATGVIESKKKDDPVGPFEKVEIEASFKGNWESFLLKNLRPDVPVDNGAPAGRHTVVVQFVVDVDGTVSDIRALTHPGYGMEEEAIRVIRKSDKWEPAFQNSKHVKAYRKQSITFEVLGDE